MAKYKLLNGELVMKKAAKTYLLDKPTLVEALKSAGQEEYLKRKEVVEVDWAKMKKDLDIVDNTIVNTSTGEVVELEGLGIEDVTEKFDVKF